MSRQKGFKHTEETKEKIRQSHLGKHFLLSKEGKEKKREATIRANHKRKGMHYVHKRIKDTNWGLVKEMIKQGESSVRIAKKVKLSHPTIRKYVKIKFPELSFKLGKNGIKCKGNYMRGFHRPSSFKGKTYEEIFGSKEKAEQRRKITSDWMKTEKNIRRFCKFPSKPQIELFNSIKEKYPEAVMEYFVRISDKKSFWLDIAIPSLKLNYELDGEYWHKDKIEEDNLRDKLLEDRGWKIIRVKYTK